MCIYISDLVKNLFVCNITLIALVITIIVLLILAGVSISMLSGENGIINKVNSAKTDNETAQQEAGEKLTSYETTVGKYNSTKVNPPVDDGVEYYVYPGDEDIIYKLKFNDDTANVTIYAVTEVNIVYAQNLATFSVKNATYYGVATLDLDFDDSILNEE